MGKCVECKAVAVDRCMECGRVLCDRHFEEQGGHCSFCRPDTISHSFHEGGEK